MSRAFIIFTAKFASRLVAQLFSHEVTLANCYGSKLMLKSSQITVNQAILMKSYTRVFQVIVSVRWETADINDQSRPWTWLSVEIHPIFAS